MSLLKGSNSIYGIATDLQLSYFLRCFCQRATAHCHPRSCGGNVLSQHPKNKAKRHCTPTTTTVPFMPVCKSVEAKLHNVAL
mgnify:CR=1 FL=1